MAKVTFVTAQQTLYAYLSGEIDHDAAQNLRLHLDHAIVNRGPQVLVLDFGGVGFMDSSGIGLILGRQKRMQALKGELRVQGVPEEIKRILRLAGIRSTAGEEFSR